MQLASSQISNRARLEYESDVAQLDDLSVSRSDG